MSASFVSSALQPLIIKVNGRPGGASLPVNSVTGIPDFRILRQIVCDDVPSCLIADECVKLRPYTRIVIKRAHSDADFRPIGPVTSEKTRTALSAKCFHRAFAFAIDLN